MSIAGLNIGTSAMKANMVALEVTGQNIANVNNADYTRQRANLTTSLTIPRSYGNMGTGVQVDQIQQIQDAYVEQQILGQTSEYNSDNVRSSVLDQLQSIFDEGSGAGLNDQFCEFFSAVQDLSSFPEDSGMRSTIVGQAELLSQQIQFVDNELDQVRLDLNSQVGDLVTDANGLLKEIAGYNTSIAQIEAGDDTVAADLRDKRTAALKELSSLIDIETTELDSGAVNVASNGRALVYSGEYNKLGLTLKEDSDLPLYDLVMEGSTDVIEFTEGKIGGALLARDQDVVSFQDGLDELAGTFIQQVNMIHSDARGLVGYSNVTSEKAVSSDSVALNQAGLALTPQDGSFDIVLCDADGNEETFTIAVDLDGAGTDDTMQDLAQNIDDQSVNISTTVNADGTLTIAAADGYTMFFSNDSSNILAALGVNGMFTGSDASDIAVSQALVENPSLLAAGASGNAGDNSTALAIVNLRDSQTMTNGTQTFEEFYQSEIARLGSEAQVRDTETDAGGSFLDSLTLERESISGVSLDEESANLIKYQQALTAAAKFIGVMNEMLNTVVNGLI